VLGVETEADFADATLVESDLASGYGEFEGLAAITQIGRHLELSVD
jgi:hypothetical protein